jgi:hypothetical protein
MNDLSDLSDCLIRHLLPHICTREAVRLGISLCYVCCEECFQLCNTDDYTWRSRTKPLPRLESGAMTENQMARFSKFGLLAKQDMIVPIQETRYDYWHARTHSLIPCHRFFCRKGKSIITSVTSGPTSSPSNLDHLIPVEEDLALSFSALNAHEQGLHHQLQRDRISILTGWIVQAPTHGLCLIPGQAAPTPTDA